MSTTGQGSVRRCYTLAAALTAAVAIAVVGWAAPASAESSVGGGVSGSSDGSFSFSFDYRNYTDSDSGAVYNNTYVYNDGHGGKGPRHGREQDIRAGHGPWRGGPAMRMGQDHRPRKGGHDHDRDRPRHRDSRR
jgi:hypothetical protein